MNNEVMVIELEQIIVKKGLVEFNQYETLKQQALELAENIEQVEVTEENIQTSKKMLAAVNKHIKEMEDKRISIKKEMLKPYETFEAQVKDIVNIVKRAESTVREQIKQLDENEREEKRALIQSLFDKRIKMYSFGEIFTFDMFLKPKHLNKSTSINVIETELVEWLEKINTDLKVIKAMPNGEEILAEYFDTKCLSTALSIVKEREERKQKAIEATKKTNEKVNKSVEHEYHIIISDERDLTMLEMFMQLKNIKYSIEKVEK